MKILVTGGTGFVGSHIVAGLVRSGHDVRLLVRRAPQVERTFQPHGPEVAGALTDVQVGDVLDEEAVATAVTGCDAVVHAAAVFSFDPRDADRVLTTNERSTQVVLSAALDAGCDPVVHVSSTVALLRRDGSGPDLPLGDLDLPYSRSKAAAEQVARRWQEQGRAVVSIYPGAVYGPLDPYLGEQTRRLTWMARGLFPLWPRGGMHVVDARDVAAVVVATMRPGQGPRRYVVPGHHAQGRELYHALGEALGRRRPVVTPPAWMLGPSTRLMDLTTRTLPSSWRYPADREASEVGLRNTVMYDAPAREELGVTPRPLAETMRDTVAWMVDTGHLPEKYRPR